MSLVSVIFGLIAAIIVYFVLTAIIVFAHSTLIFGLLAVGIFLLIALGGVPRWR